MGTLIIVIRIMLKLNISPELYQYALKFGVHEHPVLKKLRLETLKLDNAFMQIPPDQAQFMGLLAQITAAKKYIELGVFTGYSALTMALSMGKDSQVFALDNDHKCIEIAKTFWSEAEVLDQFQIFVDDALNSLLQILDNYKDFFDIAFIDADKARYLTYYEHCYKLVKPGGLILIDNVLFKGEVIDEKPSNRAIAIKEFNQFIYNDSRVKISLLPIADGLTIAYKK